MTQTSTFTVTPDPARMITDDKLDQWAEDHLNQGHKNSVPALRTVAPEWRQCVVDEGQTMMNMVPGFRFSAAVSHAAWHFNKHGEFPYTAMAHEIRERENANRWYNQASNR